MRQVKQSLGACLLGVAVAVTSLSPLPSVARTTDGLEAVRLEELPKEALEVHRLIQAGGPFEFEKDGVVFGNRERILPRESRGYYREYTVPTPRARNRGARRIVCGGREVTRPEVCYYTQDHYASFRRIAQ
jgi:ribonuclease T1